MRHPQILSVHRSLDLDGTPRETNRLPTYTRSHPPNHRQLQLPGTHGSLLPRHTLFTPFERCRGLPLGNQTSQFFANVYLDPLDHFVRDTLQPGDYFRYVDDFLLFGEDKVQLGKMRKSIEQFLYGYRLNLHPGKGRVYRVQDGVTFLGWRIFPARSRLVRPNVQRFRKKIQSLQLDYKAGRIDWDDVQASVQSWIAHAAHGDTWRLRQQIFDKFPFVLARDLKPIDDAD